MKKHCLPLSLSSLSWMIVLSSLNSVHAATITTYLKEVITPQESQGDALVLAWTDGAIYRISKDNAELIARAQAAVKNNERIDLVTYHETVSIDAIQAHALANDLQHDIIKDDPVPPAPAAEYIPTVISGRNNLYAYWKAIRSDRGFKERSQCYQRAEYWAHEMDVRWGIKSQKAFLFFTRKYITQYNYDWWFHVAPLVIYNDGTANYDAVYDKTYGPGGVIPFQEWTKMFVQAQGGICPVISKYTDYSEHEWESYCYVRKVPMYYYQPKNVQALDAQGTQVTGWIQWELNNANEALW
jgi:hypothetical protein